MKRILVAMATWMMHVPAFSQTPNVVVNLKADSVLASFPQWIYLYYYRGNDLLIEDSAFISPKHTTASMQAWIEEQCEMQITFSRKGPNHIFLIVTPQDSITIEVDERDGGGMVWKKVQGSPATNEEAEKKNAWEMPCLRLFQLENALYSISDGDSAELRKMQDSIRILKEYGKRLNLRIVKESIHPENVWGALLVPALTQQISRDSLLLLWKEACLRFPDHKKLQNLYNPQHTSPPATKEGIWGGKRILEILNHKFRTIQEEKAEKRKDNPLPEDMQTPPVPPLRGYQTLQDFCLPDENNQPIRLKEILGTSQFVIVDFWASWCIPCFKSMNLLKRIQKEYGDRITVCLVSLDKKKYYWKKAIKKHQLETFINVNAVENDRLHPDIERLEIQQIPFNYLLDSKGSIIAVNLFDKELAKKIKEIMK